MHLDLHERWVREWMHQQACIGQVEYSSVTRLFSLSPEAQAVLVDDDHSAYSMGGFDSALAVFPAVTKLEEAFRMGLGVSYDDHGPDCVCGIERMGAFSKKHRLVSEMMPRIPGLHQRLDAGAKVADVGCGGGLALIALAQAYPQSIFVGYDTSEIALNRARTNIAEAGLHNVRLCNPFQAALPQQPEFDLIATFDVIDDTLYPQSLIEQIDAAVIDDGFWLCEDIKGYETFAENLEQHTIAALLCGFSVTVYMNSGLSTRDGAGLGTPGFTAQVARQMTAASGFTGFGKPDIENPMNNYYLLSK